MFQNYALYPHMTVYDNLAFGLRYEKGAPPLIQTTDAETADILGIGALLMRKPRELSAARSRGRPGKGHGQGAAGVLFDEPLSNLDAGLREYANELASSIEGSPPP